MKKVLLIYPKTGIDPPKPHPPLAFMDMADFILKEGYKPLIIDCRIDKAWKDKILENIEDSLAVCVSCFTGYQIVNALKVAEFVKKNDFNTKVIFGGTHPTFFPEQTLKEKNVDFIILGEGELVFPKVLKKIDSCESLDGLKGVGYKQNGNLMINKEFELVDLEDSHTRWDLVDIEKYIRPSYGVDRTIIMVTSRGCPYRCGFCYNHFFNKGKWRSRRVENILDEIENLYKNHRIQGIYFVEDMFFCDDKRVEEICKGLIDRGINIKWGATHRVDRMTKHDDSFLKLLKKSGCSYLTFGVESGSQKILDLIKKDIKKEQAIEAARLCGEYGITGMFTFMCGFPEETEQDLVATMDLIDEMKKVNPKAWISGIFQYMAYPGTPLYKLALENGFKVPETMQGWANYTYFQASQNLPWIDSEKEKKLKVLSYTSRFNFYNSENEKIADSFVKKIGLLGLRGISKVRWKLRFFGMPLELGILDRKYKEMSEG